MGERQKREYQKHGRRVCSMGTTEKEGGEEREGSAASGVNWSMVHAHGTLAPAAPIATCGHEVNLCDLRRRHRRDRVLVTFTACCVR